MLNGFEIRKATIEDAENVQIITQDAFERYVKKSGITSPIDAQMEDIKDILSDIAVGYTFIAFINGKPAGSFRLFIEDQGIAKITRFGVANEFRRIGIGHELLIHADKIIREIGAHHAFLYTALSNSRLIHFYKRHGFYLESIEGTGSYPRAKLVKKITI